MHGIIGDKNLGKLRSLQISLNLSPFHSTDHQQCAGVLFMLVPQQLVARAANDGLMPVCQSHRGRSTIGYLLVQNAVGKLERFPELLNELVLLR